MEINPMTFRGALDNAYYVMYEKRKSLQGDDSDFANKQRVELSHAMSALLNVLRLFPTEEKGND